MAGAYQSGVALWALSIDPWAKVIPRARALNVEQRSPVNENIPQGRDQIRDQDATGRIRADCHG